MIVCASVSFKAPQGPEMLGRFTNKCVFYGQNPRRCFWLHVFSLKFQNWYTQEMFAGNLHISFLWVSQQNQLIDSNIQSIFLSRTSISNLKIAYKFQQEQATKIQSKHSKIHGETMLKHEFRGLGP